MFITQDIENGVARVKLNRPDVHNAFNADVIKELTDSFQKFSSMPSLRAVVLSGSGKSFCAGADLQYMKSMVDYSRGDNEADAKRLFEMFEIIFNCPVPVLGQLHGSVMGGGLGLVAVCDVVAAEKDTRFGFSEVKMGLVPAVISPFVLRKVPEFLARETMMTGEVFGCDKAERMGLVHFSGEAEEVGDFIQSKLDYFMSAGPEAVRTVKELLKVARTAAWDDLKMQTIRMIADRRASSEGQEGLRAFLEKRPPNWKSN